MQMSVTMSSSWPECRQTQMVLLIVKCADRLHHLRHGLQRRKVMLQWRSHGKRSQAACCL